MQPLHLQSDERRLSTPDTRSRLNSLKDEKGVGAAGDCLEPCDSAISAAAAAAAALIAEEVVDDPSILSADNDDSLYNARSHDATGMQHVSQPPFVWLVLSRAISSWRRRHAGDFRIIKTLREQQQQLQQQFHEDRQQWQQRHEDMLNKISSMESVLQLEQWCVLLGAVRYS